MLAEAALAKRPPHVLQAWRRRGDPCKRWAASTAVHFKALPAQQVLYASVTLTVPGSQPRSNVILGRPGHSPDWRPPLLVASCLSAWLESIERQVIDWQWRARRFMTYPIGKSWPSIVPQLPLIFAALHDCSMARCLTRAGAAMAELINRSCKPLLARLNCGVITRTNWGEPYFCRSFPDALRPTTHSMRTGYQARAHRNQAIYWLCPVRHAPDQAWNIPVLE